MSIIDTPGFGRPDYSLPIPVVRELVLQLNQVVDSSYFSNVFPTSMWAGLQVYWEPTNIPSSLTVSWTDDAVGSDLLGQASILTTSGFQNMGPVTFENQGPYASLGLEHNTSGGMNPDLLWVYLTSVPFRVSSPFRGEFPENRDSFTIPASAQLTYTSDALQIGPARLWISSTEAVTWQLQRANGYGGYIPIDGSLTADTVFRDEITLPISEWQIIVTNTTASDATANIYIGPSITGAS